jgi:hypothetical protein
LGRVDTTAGTKKIRVSNTTNPSNVFDWFVLSKNLQEHDERAILAKHAMDKHPEARLLPSYHTGQLTAHDLTSTTSIHSIFDLLNGETNRIAGRLAQFCLVCTNRPSSLLLPGHRANQNTLVDSLLNPNTLY